MMSYLKDQSFQLDKLPVMREMWLRGMTYTRIAREMGVSVNTVLEIIRHNTIGSRWPAENLELPGWIKAT